MNLRLVPKPRVLPTNLFVKDDCYDRKETHPREAPVIRPYTPEDREAVLEVWDESVPVAHPFWAPEVITRERQAIADRFLPRAETYVWERAGTIVGFVSLLGTEVGGLFVRPRCHRQGIGRALMDAARASREHLELEVFEANPIGRAFYQRYGFRVIGVHQDETTGLRVLRLRLPADTGPDPADDPGCSAPPQPESIEQPKAPGG